MNVLCLKLRSRHAVWHPPESSSAYFPDGVFVAPGSSPPTHEPHARNGIIKNFCSRVKMKNPKRTMSPPLPITEDTPPDMLAGAMDLHVVLPNGQDMKMSVERSTPMMDLLVQVTTANKISPGGHIIQAIGDRGILPYKPSTPIGALDTWTIHIVSKKQAGNMYAKKPLPRPVNQNIPFEQTFRLQVNLPRNQLYVSRVSYKIRLEEVLREVCREKNLDQSKYCFIHPEKPDEELDLSKTFHDYKLQQVTLSSKSNRPVELSSADIMALKRYDNGSQHVNNQYYASHSYDGSISSGSIEGRSLSPARSDESFSSPTIPETNTILGRPMGVRKRRPAPKPPSVQTERDSKHVSKTLIISHSRNSSDSSGYHESSVLSESPESNSNSLANSLPRRSKLPSDDSHDSELATHRRPRPSKYTNSKIGSNLSRSLSNLAVIGNKKANMLSNATKLKEYSTSSMSLTSISGKKKKAPAPPPPTATKSLLSLKEEDVFSDNLPSTHVPVETMQKSQTLPVTTALSELSTPESLRLVDSTQEYRAPHVVDSRHHPTLNLSTDVVDSASVPVPYSARRAVEVAHLKEKEFTMDDDEIDRIFNDATKDYESSSLSTVPFLPESYCSNPAISIEEQAEDISNWQYKLPSPPKAFRDQKCDPPVAKYGPSYTKISNNEEERRPIESNVMLNNLKNSIYNERHNRTHSKNSIMNGDLKQNEKPNAASSPIVCSTSVTQITYHERPVEKANVESARGRAARISEEAVKAVEKSKSRVHEQRFVTSNCDMSTNDSGLGSDDSIPSMSEGKCGLDESCYAKNRNEIKLPDRRNTLQNFTITTYHNSNSKPTEIFHDDSVKTSKTTQMAKNNHPFVKTPNENTPSKYNGLSRHSSFNSEKTPNSVIKRSKSHISLLSGNFTKFNRLNKLAGRGDNEECSSVSASTENLSVSRGISKSENSTSCLRRAVSEFRVNQDCDKEEDEESRNRNLKCTENERRSVIFDSMKKNEQLQSLQVLKDILPQINRTGHVPVPATTKVMPAEPATFSVKPRPLSDYQPAVNLQSWNERPKRQFSIKTDRDYVFGNNRRNCDSRDGTSRVDQTDLACSQDGHANTDRREDSSRVPIVRAVEFKKPYVEQISQSKPDVPKDSNSRQINVDQPAVKSKQRPSSFYLFGENAATKELANESARISNAYEKEIHGLKKSPVKRYTELGSEACHKVENYTFKNYKSKLMENGNKRFENGECRNQNSEQGSMFKTFGKSESLVTKRGIGIHPVPILPLSGASRLRHSNQQSFINESPRDVLLSSIKNFNRDNLRKLQVK